jgi:hypothetical protein
MKAFDYLEVHRHFRYFRCLHKIFATIKFKVQISDVIMDFISLHVHNKLSMLCLVVFNKQTKACVCLETLIRIFNLIFFYTYKHVFNILLVLNVEVSVF